MHSIESLARDTNSLAPLYSRFRVADRLLLTGHSHQAWPDVAFEGQNQAWLDAAEFVDEKWLRAEQQADAVRAGFARLLDDRDGLIALGTSTHELVIRFLSALPLEQRPRLVTTDGEFHTLRRQLDRFAETGRIEVVKVPALPAATAADRLAAAVNDRTAAVLASSVLFANSHMVPGLGRVLEACRKVGAELLVDVYHQLNVVPVSVEREHLGGAFVVGGGYKYCQLGEGNCFLRVPPGRDELAPVITGWFSEFGRLAQRPEGAVPYGEGAARWAGATYDPTSHYRAARVFNFFEAQSLSPEFLRAVSQSQIGVLASAFDSLDLDPRIVTRDRDTPLAAIGGFLALISPHAEELSLLLRARGVATDVRGPLLRLGPAPYLSDSQLRDAIAVLGTVVRQDLAR